MLDAFSSRIATMTGRAKGRPRKEARRKEVELRWLERAISFVVVLDLSRCARRNVKAGLLKKHGQPIGRESIEKPPKWKGASGASRIETVARIAEVLHCPQCLALN
jgi:hypothetical protein